MKGTYGPWDVIVIQVRRESHEAECSGLRLYATLILCDIPSGELSRMSLVLRFKTCGTREATLLRIFAVFIIY